MLGFSIIPTCAAVSIAHGLLGTNILHGSFWYGRCFSHVCFSVRARSGICRSLRTVPFLLYGCIPAIVVIIGVVAFLLVTSVIGTVIIITVVVCRQAGPSLFSWQGRDTDHNLVRRTRHGCTGRLRCCRWHGEPQRARRSVRCSFDFDRFSFQTDIFWLV